MEHRPGMGVFDKSALKSAFSSILGQRSKILPSQTPQSNTALPKILAVASPSVLEPHPPLIPPEPLPTTQSQFTNLSTTATLPKVPLESTALVDTTIYVNPDVRTNPIDAPSLAAGGAVQNAAEEVIASQAKTPVNSIVLPDGSTRISGKGLGRGRPGVKRGPRKPKSTISTPTAAAGKKRKRSSDSSNERKGSGASVSESGSDSEDYTPQATQTRSGRHTQRPITYVPSESPVTKKARFVDEPATTSIQRKVYRGKDQNALCEHCLRGHGPVENAIVFCDGCNRCWHQQCHTPRIAKELILDAATEWFCASCTATIAKPEKVNTETNNIRLVKVEPKPVRYQDINSPTPALTSSVPNAYLAKSTSLVGGNSLTSEQRQSYLDSLTRERLIELLLQASNLAPDLPLFEEPTPLPVPPSASNIRTTTAAIASASTAMHSAPATGSPNPAPTTNTTSRPQRVRSSNHNSGSSPSGPTPTRNLNYSEEASDASEDDYEEVEEEEEDEEDYFYDDHAKLYPVAGKGIQLPPESEDLSMLLEGPDCRTFSHTLRNPASSGGGAGGMGLAIGGMRGGMGTMGLGLGVGIGGIGRVGNFAGVQGVGAGAGTGTNIRSRVAV